jgi:hypothetical protein
MTELDCLTTTFLHLDLVIARQRPGPTHLPQKRLPTLNTGQHHNSVVYGRGWTGTHGWVEVGGVHGRRMNVGEAETNGSKNRHVPLTSVVGVPSVVRHDGDASCIAPRNLLRKGERCCRCHNHGERRGHRDQARSGGEGCGRESTGQDRRNWNRVPTRCFLPTQATCELAVVTPRINGWVLELERCTREKVWSRPLQKHKATGNRQKGAQGPCERFFCARKKFPKITPLSDSSFQRVVTHQPHSSLCRDKAAVQ